MTSMTATTKRRLTPGGRAGFRQALACEWTKIVTQRATAWSPVVTAATMVGLAVFVGATESLQPDDTVLGGSLTGGGPALIGAGVFGALAITAEYGTGMIRTTFAACPRRLTVLAAKTVVVATMMFVAALVASLLAHRIGVAFLSGQGYEPGEPMPALLGFALCFSAVGVLGLAAGTLLRSSAGAVIAVVCVVLLPSLIAPLFGDGQRWVAGSSPMAALQKLTQSSDAAPDVAGSLGAWSSLGLVGAYTTVALVVAAGLLRRRDA